ncbi:MAG: BatD family protein [Bacteroidales bacterium]|jgi:hypothetical protein|nr:BatD family protein [Bacteroidales bacterium]
MNKCLKILLSLFVIQYSLLALSAQEITLSLQAPSEIAVGQPFQIVFELKSNGQSISKPQFTAPTMKDFQISGPFTSQSSNTSWINGKMSSSQSISYIYSATAIKEGNFTISEAKVVVGNETYKSTAKSIKVVKGNANNAQNSNSGGSRQSQGNSNNMSSEIGKDDLFIKVNANKSTLYEGEEVILFYKIYTTVGIAQYSIHKIPLSPNFWVEEMQRTQQRSTPENYNGKQYQTAVLRKVAVYPQMSGKQHIEPLEINAIAQVAAQRKRPKTGSIFDIFDDPFFSFGGYENKEMKLVSNAVSFNVKPLPTEGKPESFKGAVGNYTFKAEIDKTKLKTNDAVSIKITVSGKGNLKHIQAPNVVFPEDFDVYEPNESENIGVNEGGMNGSKTFEYIAIPRTQGIFEIPEIKFSYFNPASEKYVENTFQKQQITVEQGSSETNISAENKNDYANRDIEFIKTGSFKLYPAGKMFLFSPLFWSIFAAIPILFCLFLLIVKEIDARNKDIVGLKRKKALKEATKCLKKAAQFMKNNNHIAFYNEISQALWGFLRNKFNIATADLSVDNVKIILQDKNMQSEDIDDFIAVLNDCEFARFAPSGHTSQSMGDIYNKALQNITNIALNK